MEGFNRIDDALDFFVSETSLFEAGPDARQAAEIPERAAGATSIAYRPAVFQLSGKAVELVLEHHDIFRCREPCRGYQGGDVLLSHGRVGSRTDLNIFDYGMRN
jgi:hypothetical protein